MKIDQGSGVFTFDQVGCARCGGEGHKPITFKKLQKPSELPGGIKFTHWAPCPTTGEPIMFAQLPHSAADALERT